MKKNILMVCYYYPPLTDVGCKRSVAFSRYLKKYGWTPYVLSVKNPDKTYCSLGNDKPPPGIHTEYSYSLVNLYKLFGKMNGLLYRVVNPLGVEIKRNYFYDIFCIPDVFLGWILLAAIKGLHLMREFKIDIIYISCSPFSSAVVGVLLKLITKKHLVIDFRDPFALKKVSKAMGVPKFRIKMNQWIEKNLLKHADIFVVTSYELKQAYIQQYPQVKGKIFEVHNGFDVECLIQNRVRKYPKFTIVYSGDFYFGTLSSEVFFEAIALLKKTAKISTYNFQFLFYGDGRAKIEQISKKHGIDDLVQASPRIPFKDISMVLSSSHLQFLRVVELAAPTKLFEGIAFNTPFLATIPKGEAEEIIRKYSPSSYIITEESSEKVAWAILDAIKKYKNNEILDNRANEFLEHYSRENLTLKLMRIMEENLP